MKAATIHEIKKELEAVDVDQIRLLCLRLAKFKKENKELLSYLLFEAHNESSYVNLVKEEITEQFLELPNLNTYYVKKSLRRILRMVNKQIKYSGITTSELELRIHFCQHVIEAGIPLSKSPVLMNLYQQQLKKIKQALSKLHEDVQYDYQAQIEGLTV